MLARRINAFPPHPRDARPVLWGGKGVVVSCAVAILPGHLFVWAVKAHYTHSGSLGGRGVPPPYKKRHEEGSQDEWGKVSSATQEKVPL